MRRYRALLALCIPSIAFAQTWDLQPSSTTASLRGVQALSTKIVWASGTGGTFLRTLDGGAHWIARVVPGASNLDFRGLHALDEHTAWLLSSGPGDQSRIYKTADGGEHWSLLYTNPDAKGFLDAIAFWDADRGVVLGDPVDGHFVVLITSDGGSTWKRLSTLPPALPNEGAFAASNSCLVLRPGGRIFFVTGGPGGARVFRSSDGGEHWTTTSTPLRNDGPGAGIFSLAFADPMHAIAVGGDYGKPSDHTANVAITTGGGKTWLAPTGVRPDGYRSAVVYLPEQRAWIATGTSGSDFSIDNGMNWKQFGTGAYNALAVAGGSAWAVGPEGRIARLSWKVEGKGHE